MPFSYIVGMPPPPAAITSVPVATSRWMESNSTMPCGCGLGITQRQPRPASGATVQPRRAATASASGSSSAVTSTEWSRTTASFSSAMLVTVGPSQRVWSRATPVSTWTFDGITLVAS